MPRQTIHQFRALVRSLNYFVSLHAAEELDDDNLSILDLENIILTGQIVAHQRDRQNREVKHVSEGSPLTTPKPRQSLKSGRAASFSSSPSTSSSDVCASCGQPGVQLRKVTRSFGRGQALLIIENIPLWSCPHCGVPYFTAQTMHEIERIKTLRNAVAVDRTVPVAEFGDQGV